MRLWGAVGFSMLVAGCGSPGPTKLDVTGMWDATVTYTTCTTQNLDSRKCGQTAGREILTLAQTDNQVSGRDYSLIILQGQLAGETLAMDGFGTDPIGATTTQQWRLRVSGDRMTGTLSESFVSPIGLPDTSSQGTRATTGEVVAVRRQ